MPLAAGFGDAASPQKSKNRLNRFQSSRARGVCGRSILVRHHYCDGGFWLVHVEGAANGNQFEDIRGFSWLTQAKSAEELKKRAFRTEIMGGRAAYFG